MTELEAPLVEIARELWKDSGEPDLPRMEDRRKRFATGRTCSKPCSDGGDYLVGDTFSVADVVVGGVLSFARMAEITELSPGIVPYVDNLEARPARQRAYTRTA